MRKLFRAALIVATFAVSYLAYRRMPERVTIHWDLAGNPNGWGSRAVGAFLVPALLVGVWALLDFLPRIDPRRANYEKFRGTYDLVVDAVMVTMAFIHLLALGATLNLGLPTGRIGVAAMGVLFIVLGNVLPRARSNFWFGIRTPWTLSSERVWERTHRVGGYIFVACGLLYLVAAAVAMAHSLLVGTTIVLLVVPVGYSYIAWREETQQ